MNPLIEQIREALFLQKIAKAGMSLSGSMRHSASEFGLYFIECEDLVKIGKAKDVFERIKTLQTGCPARLRIAAFFERKGNLEGDFHKKFRHLRVNGEWFLFTNEIRTAITELKSCST